MAKWFGKVGYATTKETSPGVWKEVITEREYFGKVIDDSRRYQAGDKVNGDITVSSKISIVSDQFADENFHSIRYAKFMGANWAVINAQPKRPRLILTLGGLYNGKQA